jgi:Transferrin
MIYIFFWAKLKIQKFMTVPAFLNRHKHFFFQLFFTAEFRYEGIILIRKNANIHSLNDLKGLKACHTGYGRTVGYKVNYSTFSIILILC